MPTPEVEAAGAVTLRVGSGDALEVLVVHRPRYDDWSLPKGKLDDGEKHTDAAVREVEEETGVLVTLHDELDEHRYRDRKGRRKRVRWWLATPVAGRPAHREPDAEVDEACWAPVDEAADLLTYDDDRARLQQALTRLGDDR